MAYGWVFQNRTHEEERDGGYITLDDDGRIWVSNRLTAEALGHLGISREARRAGLDPRHQAYLEHH